MYYETLGHEPSSCEPNVKPINLYVVPRSPPCRAVIISAKYLKINVNLIYVDSMKGMSGVFISEDHLDIFVY